MSTAHKASNPQIPTKSASRHAPPPLVLINIPPLLRQRRLLIIHRLLQRRRRILLRSTPCISSWSRILLLLLLLLLLQVIRMRQILHRRRRGVDGDQFDGTAVLVDVNWLGLWKRRILLVAVGSAVGGDGGEGDVLDWSGLAVVWLVVVVVRVWVRVCVGGLVFVDDAVARWGA
jgi:hypothetical protein